MRFRRVDPFGNHNVGVFARATARHLWVAPGITKQNRVDLSEALGLEAVELTIGGSPLVGSLVAANSRGAVVADLATDAELELLAGAGLKTMRLAQAPLNAAGNNVLCNDKGAVVHPELSDDALVRIGQTLGVEAVRGEVARVTTIGTACVATESGVLVHPLANEAETELIKEALHAPARIGTVNHGQGFVGAGLVANHIGVVVGSRTTGIELGRIDEALFSEET